MRVIEASMEQGLDERARETGDPRENPPTNGVVRHDSPMEQRLEKGEAGVHEKTRGPAASSGAIPTGVSPRSTLASHQGEPGSTPGRVTGLSQVLDDAVGRQVFSVISDPLHSGAAHS
ncbi:hypothetical protein PR048_030592 [Dryococelus australis]|uniref:Uncharacterized protein n=1 Tax=Dryococelus australis TaxID=614101 RepID=A0ABQ9GD88_9NEOP|nr:hypothetical protein PR048_030592 [Dryococelus australis]